MLGKGTKLYSILRFKCPRCHEGDFYKRSSHTAILGMGRVNDYCSNVALKYNIEPSFFSRFVLRYLWFRGRASIILAVWILQLLFFPGVGPGTLLLAFDMDIAPFLFSPTVCSYQRLSGSTFL